MEQDKSLVKVIGSNLVPTTPLVEKYRPIWLGLTAFFLVCIYFWHDHLANQLVKHLASIQTIQMSYGICFALLAILIMGTLSHFRVVKMIPVLRMMTLVLTGLIAVIDFQLHHFNLPSNYTFIIVASGLIGISCVSLLARYFPDKLMCYWLGLY